MIIRLRYRKWLLRRESPTLSNYIDASQLKTPDDIKRAVLKYTVFGRVTPDQKRQFVRALKEAGKTVAMTGDGVNDVLALKDADCSIAMASGSDAAAQASQLVLLESNFSCMPSVVLEGRRVVNNIERSASLFLVKNIFSFLLSLFSMAFMITYPLEPSQISMVSHVHHWYPGIPAGDGTEQEDDRGTFPYERTSKSSPGGTYGCVDRWFSYDIWTDVWTVERGDFHGCYASAGDCRTDDPL